MVRTVIAHLRAQWMGALSLFLVIAGGTAYAANTIGSEDVIDNSLLTGDIRNNQLRSVDVRDDTVTGGGLAAVDLQAGSVGPSEADGLRGGDIVESSLGRVPSALTATLGGLGRGGAVQDTCNPENLGFATCATVQLTVPPGPGARALVLGRVRAFPDPGASGDIGLGSCQLGSSAIGLVPDTNIPLLVETGDWEVVTLAGITPVLGPGLHTFGIDCNQTDTDSGIDYDSASVQAVAISSG